MYNTYCLAILLLAAGCSADFYDASSGVVELTPSNFDQQVTNSDDVWLIEFYAPWCGHCKNLVPEYKKAAKALKGIVKVGAVNADNHNSLSQKYGVSGFPAIKLFTGSKHVPYSGGRTADGLVDAALKALKSKAYMRLGRSGDEDGKVMSHGIANKTAYLMKLRTLLEGVQRIYNRRNG